MSTQAEAKQEPDFSQRQKLYERANDARRNGDHDNYNRLCLELVAYNARVALSRVPA